MNVEKSFEGLHSGDPRSRVHSGFGIMPEPAGSTRNSTALWNNYNQGMFRPTPNIGLADRTSPQSFSSSVPQYRTQKHPAFPAVLTPPSSGTSGFAASGNNYQDYDCFGSNYQDAAHSSTSSVGSLSGVSSIHGPPAITPANSLNSTYSNRSQSPNGSNSFQQIHPQSMPAAPRSPTNSTQCSIRCSNIPANSMEIFRHTASSYGTASNDTSNSARNQKNPGSCIVTFSDEQKAAAFLCLLPQHSMFSSITTEIISVDTCSNDCNQCTGVSIEIPCNLNVSMEQLALNLSQIGPVCRLSQDCDYPNKTEINCYYYNPEHSREAAKSLININGLFLHPRLIQQYKNPNCWPSAANATAAADDLHLSSADSSSVNSEEISPTRPARSLYSSPLSASYTGDTSVTCHNYSLNPDTKSSLTKTASAMDFEPFSCDDPCSEVSDITHLSSLASDGLSSTPRPLAAVNSTGPGSHPRINGPVPTPIQVCQTSQCVGNQVQQAQGLAKVPFSGQSGTTGVKGSKGIMDSVPSGNHRVIKQNATGRGLNPASSAVSPTMAGSATSPYTSIGNVGGMGTLASAGPMNAIGAIGSRGSIGSIASVASAASIGSMGSRGSIGSIGSPGSLGSLGSMVTMGPMASMGFDAPTSPMSSVGSISHGNTRNGQVNKIGQFSTHPVPLASDNSKRDNRPVGTIGSIGTVGAVGAVGTIGAAGNVGSVGHGSHMGYSSVSSMPTTAHSHTNKRAPGSNLAATSGSGYGSGYGHVQSTGKIDTARTAAGNNSRKREAGSGNSVAVPSSHPTHSTFVPSNEVNVDAIYRGEETRTTIMLRNIPNKVDLKTLKKFLDKTNKNTYDFLYLRIDFSNKCNVGYAFISFTSPENLAHFVEARRGRKWEKYSSDKVVDMSFANFQGRENLISKFRNSPVMNADPEYRPKLFYTTGRRAGSEEPFPPPDNDVDASGASHCEK